MLDSEREKRLKSYSNTLKRALKDMYLSFLEVRKYQKPSEEICKKLDDAIYRFVREYLKEYNTTELVNSTRWLTRDLPQYIFSSYMPEYLEGCITQSISLAGDVRNYQYGNKVFSQMNKMDEFNLRIRDIYYTYIDFMTNTEKMTDEALKKIVNNIFTTAKQTKHCINTQFCQQYLFKYRKATGYDVPEGILLIAKKYIEDGQLYTEENAIADLKKYITNNRSAFIEAQNKEEQQIKEKLDELFGLDEEISYEPCCFCFKKPVSNDKYNFGINIINNNEATYNILPLTNKLYLDEKEFYKFYKS